MRYFPVFIDLAGRRCLVVGGGEKALQKLRLLADTPAHVTIVAPNPIDDIVRLAKTRGWTLDRGAFDVSSLDGAALICIDGDTVPDAAEIAAAARNRGIPVNVVDRPETSSFITPAVVNRSPVIAAIGTEGTAPILAREIKAKLEAWLPANFGAVAARSGGLRQRIAAAVPDGQIRRRLWERLLRGTWRNAVLAGDDGLADRTADTEIAAAVSGALAGGSVTLIGCGPGDPDLLTLKAQQRLQEADVIVFDRLVNPAILDYARRDAIRIDAGKEPQGPSVEQAQINQILVREALKGHRVARLKGGDAFIFGRAAEEMAAVGAAGIPVEIVPGITAAHACAASVGLPLTLRRKVQSFSVVTGASAEGDPDLDWSALSRTGTAFAVYMGVRTADQIRAKLLTAGARPELSTVIVENGTLASERVITCDLEHLSDAISAHHITGPAVIFFGLDWRDACLSRPDKATAFVANASTAPDRVDADNREGHAELPM